MQDWLTNLHLSHHNPWNYINGSLFALAQCECFFEIGGSQKGNSTEWQQMIWSLEYFTFVFLCRGCQVISIYFNDISLPLAASYLQINLSLQGLQMLLH